VWEEVEFLKHHAGLQTHIVNKLATFFVLDFSIYLDAIYFNDSTRGIFEKVKATQKRAFP